MRPFIAITLLMLLLAACGQTGPLYLEKDGAPSKTSSAQVAQPATTTEAAESGQDASLAPAPAATQSTATGNEAH